MILHSHYSLFSGKIKTQDKVKRKKEEKENTNKQNFKVTIAHGKEHWFKMDSALN